MSWTLKYAGEIESLYAAWLFLNLLRGLQPGWPIYVLGRARSGDWLWLRSRIVLS